MMVIKVNMDLFQSLVPHLEQAIKDKLLTRKQAAQLLAEETSTIVEIGPPMVPLDRPEGADPIVPKP